MKVTISSKKGLKTNLKVFVDKKTIKDQMSARLDELSKTVNLKGFRPGKVPAAVLKQQFGKAIYAEVLEKVLKETSTKALDEKKLKVAGHPKLELKSHGEDKDLNYTIEVNELPSVKLQVLEKIKFDDYEVKVEEDEIKKRINDIAKNQNNFEQKNEKETAANGDLVAFDYEATINNKSFEGGEGKNTQIVLGKNLFLEGFDEQLIGVKKNDEKNVSTTLPSNYPKKEFANKKAIFKCKILNLKKPKPIKIDNEFAKNLGAKDLDDLNQLISKQIKSQYKMALDSTTKEKILDQIEKLHEVDLPENLVNEEVALMSQNLKKEDVEKNKKETENIAKKRIKLGLILNELGEQNKLKVGDEELKKEIQKQVESMPNQQKQVLEYYSKNPAATASLRGSIYEEKIINLIKEKSKSTKITVSTKEADEILKGNLKTKKPKKQDKSASKNKKIRKK